MRGAHASGPMPFSQWRVEVPFPASSPRHGARHFRWGRPAAAAAISGAAVNRDPSRSAGRRAPGLEGARGGGPACRRGGGHGGQLRLGRAE